MYTFFFFLIFFSIMVYHRILNTAEPCCALIFLVCSNTAKSNSSNSKSEHCLFTPSPRSHKGKERGCKRESGAPDSGRRPGTWPGSSTPTCHQWSSSPWGFLETMPVLNHRCPRMSRAHRVCWSPRVIQTGSKACLSLETRKRAWSQHPHSWPPACLGCRHQASWGAQCGTRDKFRGRKLEFRVKRLCDIYCSEARGRLKDSLKAQDSRGSS